MTNEQSKRNEKLGTCIYRTQLIELFFWNRTKSFDTFNSERETIRLQSVLIRRNTEHRTTSVFLF